jgi:hypothetical protein
MSTLYRKRSAKGAAKKATKRKVVRSRKKGTARKTRRPR